MMITIVKLFEVLNCCVASYCVGYLEIVPGTQP